MKKDFVFNHKKFIEENEKLADGRILFSIRKDKLIYRYFKLDDKYFMAALHYDLSHREKAWFDEFIEKKKVLNKKYPFDDSDSDGNSATYREAVINEITEEEYLEAKKEHSVYLDNREKERENKRLAKEKLIQDHYNMNDGKTAYIFHFEYDGRFHDEVFVRAHNTKEAKVLAREKHADFTKNWAYPEAYLLAYCNLVEIIYSNPAD